MVGLGPVRQGAEAARFLLRVLLPFQDTARAGTSIGPGATGLPDFFAGFWATLLRHGMGKKLLNFALVFACAWEMSCGGAPVSERPSVAEPAPPAPPEVVRVVPALAQVAPNAEWVLGAPVLDEARALASLVLDVNGLLLPGTDPVHPRQIAGWWRDTFGASPLESDGLRALGLDPERSAAGFGVDALPGVVLPVVDRQRAAATVRRLASLASGPVDTESDGAREWGAWAAGPTARVAYWLSDEWLVIRLSGRPPADGNALRQPPAIAGWEVATPSLARALERARALVDEVEPLFGTVDVPATAAALARAAGAEPCLAGVAGASPRVAIAAARPSGKRGAQRAWRVHVTAELSETVRAELDSALAGAGPPGFAGYRDQTGVDLALAVDSRRVSEMLDNLGCRSARAEWAAATAELRRAAGAVAARVAVEHLTSTASDLRGAAWFALADPRPLRQAVGRVPGWLQGKRTMAGYKVRVIDVPLTPFVAYVDSGSEFTIAAGEGRMERVLAAAGADPAEVGGAGLRPDRFADPGEAIRTVASLVKVPGLSPTELDRRLRDLFRRFSSITARARLEPEGLVLRLRAEPRSAQAHASF